jgi:hypothetical protein
VGHTERERRDVLRDVRTSLQELAKEKLCRSHCAETQQGQRETKKGRGSKERPPQPGLSTGRCTVLSSAACFSEREHFCFLCLFRMRASISCSRVLLLLLVCASLLGVANGLRVRDLRSASEHGHGARPGPEAAAEAKEPKEQLKPARQLVSPPGALHLPHETDEIQQKFPVLDTSNWQLDDLSPESLSKQFAEWSVQYAKVYETDEARRAAFRAFCRNAAIWTQRSREGKGFFRANVFADVQPEDFRRRFMSNYTPSLEDKELAEQAPVWSGPDSAKPAGEDGKQLGTLPAVSWQWASTPAKDQVRIRSQGQGQSTIGQVLIGFPVAGWLSLFLFFFFSFSLSLSLSLSVCSQEQCGSCWSFSVTAVLETGLCLYRSSCTLLTLSPQQLVDCDTMLDNGCNGGMPQNAFAFLKTTRSYLDSVYPYRGFQQWCLSGATWNHPYVPAYGTGPNVQNYYAAVAPCTSSYCPASRSTEVAMLNALQKYGPFSAVIDASAIENGYYAGKIINSRSGCSSAYTSLNHAVVIVGYNPTGNYWLVRNSWGTQWGANGYFYVAFGENACGIANQPFFITV